MVPVPLASPPHLVQRLAFLGTPPAAVPCLRGLVQAGFEVALVITQPDRRRGRGGRLVPSAVKTAAQELGLTVGYDPAQVLDVAPDLAVVVAYGRIIPRSLLEQVPMVNVHFSLLPRWRGAAPVERAILAGDTETGVAIMEVAEGLDEGGIYAQQRVDIDRHESAAQLTERLADLGARLLVDTLRTGLDRPVPQRGEPNYAAKLTPAEARLDFDRTADELHRRIRVGRAWTTFRGRRLVIERATAQTGDTEPGRLIALADGRWAVGTGAGLLELLVLKPEGGRSMSVIDWANGFHPRDGELVGQPG